MNSKQTDTPAVALARLKLYRFPVSIGIGAMVIDIVARTWSDFDVEFMHIVEGVLFPLAAIFLVIASRFDQKVSDTVFRVDVWLALALGLGGLRSALWAARMNPFDSNKVTFILGVIAAPTVVFLLRTRTSQAKPSMRSFPTKTNQQNSTDQSENRSDQSRSVSS